MFIQSPTLQKRVSIIGLTNNKHGYYNTLLSWKINHHQDSFTDDTKYFWLAITQHFNSLGNSHISTEIKIIFLFWIRVKKKKTSAWRNSKELWCQLLHTSVKMNKLMCCLSIFLKSASAFSPEDFSWKIWSQNSKKKKKKKGPPEIF